MSLKVKKIKWIWSLLQEVLLSNPNSSNKKKEDALEEGGCYIKTVPGPVWKKANNNKLKSNRG